MSAASLLIKADNNGQQFRINSDLKQSRIMTGNYSTVQQPATFFIFFLRHTHFNAKEQIEM